MTQLGICRISGGGDQGILIIVPEDSDGTIRVLNSRAVDMLISHAGDAGLSPKFVQIQL